MGRKGAGSNSLQWLDDSNLTDWLVIQTQLVVYSKSDQTGRNFMGDQVRQRHAEAQVECPQ